MKYVMPFVILPPGKGYSFYNFREHKGLLRNLQFRICTTGEVMVNVVFGEDDKKSRAEILSFMDALFPAITTLLYTVNLKWNDSLYDQEPVVYKGKGYVEERLKTFGLRLAPSHSFKPIRPRAKGCTGLQEALPN
jgi:23S rRNA (uracil1939-C5)-methyltransferase